MRLFTLIFLLLPSITQAGLINFYRYDPYFAIEFPYPLGCYVSIDWKAKIDAVIPNKTGISQDEAWRRASGVKLYNHEFFDALCSGEQLWRVAQYQDKPNRLVKSCDAGPNGSLSNCTNTGKDIPAGTRCHGAPLNSTITTAQLMPLLSPFEGYYTYCQEVPDSQIKTELQQLMTQ